MNVLDRILVSVIVFCIYLYIYEAENVNTRTER